MNYKECQNLLNYLNGASAFLYYIKVKDKITSNEDNAAGSLNEQIYTWNIQLQRIQNNLYSYMYNYIPQNEEHDSQLLSDELYALANEILSLEAIENYRAEQNYQYDDSLKGLKRQLERIKDLKVIIRDQQEQDSQYHQELEDLDLQLEHENKTEKSLNQQIIDNEELINQLTEEKEEKESKLNRLKKKIEDMNDKLKKQKREVEEEEKRSKGLDEEILYEEDKLEKLRKNSNLVQQYLESIKEENIGRENVLKKLQQEKKDLGDQIFYDEENKSRAIQLAESQHVHIIRLESNLRSFANNIIRYKYNTELDSESEEFAFEQSEGNFMSLRDELQEDTTQYENSDEEHPTQSLQDSTISSTTQEEVLSKETQTQLEMLSKETQTSNMQYNKTIRYIMIFTIPSALAGISLTAVPLIKSTENDTIFLSVGLSFSTLAIICFVAVTIYNYYSESTADSELPKKLSDNSIDNIITQKVAI